MGKKLFVALFFDKKRFILLFLFLVSAACILVLKQAAPTEEEPETIEIPDMELVGGSREAGLDGLILELKKAADDETEVYGMTGRDLFTFSSPFYQVTFRMHWAEEGFLERFEDKLAYGSVPVLGKKQVLAGSNAALYYGLEVGDVLTEKMEFDADIDADGYVVSGILKDEDRYYGNGFYILKEEYQGKELMPKDNMVMIYAFGKQNYKELTHLIYQIKSEYSIAAYTDNYKSKAGMETKQEKGMMLSLGAGFLLLELLFVYISKGMGKKAGIIKALGISDGRVLAICGCGLGLLILTAAVLVSVISLIFFEIERSTLIRLLPGLCVLVFLLLFCEIAVLYKKIEPSACMIAK